MSIRNIAILGSTGSIGRNALEVINRFPDRFRVTYLTAHRNIALLKEQIRRFRPRGVVILDESLAPELRTLLDGSTEVLAGEAGLLEIAQRDDTDVLVSALVGFAGLKPTLGAIRAGKHIALANKEVLVVAGEIVMREVQRHGATLIPVDSEHSAVLQCLQGEDPASVERIILTASGGPFLHLPKEVFPSVTVEQALNHPTWKMGNKITIDSATMMNKGLEVIEAHWLFGLAPERIEVAIHPQSIVHSMVEFADGSIKAQLGIPDMQLPIQYALMYPERPPAPHQRIDFSRLHQMTFEQPDPEKFRCLGLARRALATGTTAPATMNAANEVAVQLFLEGKITFDTIPSMIEEALTAHPPADHCTLDNISAADASARKFCRQQPASVH
jgi:1-deoxy-D-xylulose-5-phosphate reductoisomerase